MNTIFNLTNFTSAAVANNILAAMQDTLKTGLAQYVTNRRGRLWLRVDIKRDDHGRMYFQFLTDTMQEVGHHLLKAALFHWSRGDEREFSGLHAALYRLPIHPFDALLASQEEAKQIKRGVSRIRRLYLGWVEYCRTRGANRVEAL
ncbi:hypothetical protein [Pseudomonas sp. ANT_J28]|uniref:hypothetical protein n=1 Tax=Pseudomonas sp. ANT_J28 TaxID=2597352 RepID=UPI0011F0CA23|nr:hypothetical protein [Pseudomonas sp. ANT_J28]KAA0973244.1 hypothetical protein FQ187_29790 [Pseudomonas sp. ANT_J28]